jgi:hypothetical protein
VVHHGGVHDCSLGLAAGHHLGTFGDGVLDEVLDLLDRFAADAGTEDDVALRGSPAGSAFAFAANFATNASATFSSTMMRSVDMQI